MNTKTVLILGAFILVSGTLAGFLARSPFGRYQAVQRENNRMMVIDTATGRTWDSMRDRSWVEYPPLPTAPRR